MGNEMVEDREVMGQTKELSREDNPRGILIRQTDGTIIFHCEGSGERESVCRVSAWEVSDG